MKKYFSLFLSMLLILSMTATPVTASEDILNNDAPADIVSIEGMTESSLEEENAENVSESDIEPNEGVISSGGGIEPGQTVNGVLEEDGSGYSYTFRATQSGIYRIDANYQFQGYRTMEISLEGENGRTYGFTTYYRSSLDNGSRSFYVGLIKGKVYNIVVKKIEVIDLSLFDDQPLLPGSGGNGSSNLSTNMFTLCISDTNMVQTIEETTSYRNNERTSPFPIEENTNTHKAKMSGMICEDNSCDWYLLNVNSGGATFNVKGTVYNDTLERGIQKKIYRSSETTPIQAVPLEITTTGEDITLPMGSYEICVERKDTGVTNASYDINVTFNQAPSYTVTYDGNGNTQNEVDGAVTPQSFSEGGSAIIKNCSFRRSGYVFKNWNTKKDGSGTTYTPGSTYNTKQNITLYAQWDVPVTGVSLNETELELIVGKTTSGKPIEASFDLIATIIPSNATTDRTVTWTSSAPSVAEVVNGTIIIKNYGHTDITVRTNYGGYTKTCAVDIVEPDNITGLVMNKSSMGMIVGGEETLYVNSLPQGTVVKNVTWTSTNPSVATVDANGKVKAVSAGYTDVKATTLDSKYSATCRVTVSGGTQTAFSVTYYPNGADSGMVTPQQFTNSVVIKSNSYTRGGYVFKNWNTKEDGTGTTYKPGASYSSRADLVLYAQWTLDATDIPISNITLDKSKLNMSIGGTASLKATKYPSAAPATIIWATRNSNVAKVDANGEICTVTAVGNGTTVISATTASGNVRAECEVTVSGSAPATRSISFTQDTYNVSVGRSVMTGIIWSPFDTPTEPLIYSSMDSNTATVNASSGEITGVKEGRTAIYAFTSDRRLSAMCYVVVGNGSVTGITLYPKEVTLKPGQTQALVWNVLPADASDKMVFFSTTDKAVATINDYGVITAVTEGLATITATTKDGGYSESCEVKIVSEGYHSIPVTGIKLYDHALTMMKNESAFINASVVPVTASNKKLLYSSDNTDVAEISEDGYIRTYAAGSANITVSTEEGGYRAICRLKVRDKDSDIIDIKTMTLNKSSATIKLDSGFTLSVKITPANATYNDYTWESSNTRSVIVDNGYVYGVADGFSVITARSSDGVHAAKCKINVVDSAAKHYNVSYKMGVGGATSNPDNPDKYVPGSEIGLKPAQKEGLIFRGWFRDSRFENSASKISRNDSGNLTFYAKWDKIPYTITYNYDGASAVNNKTEYNVTTSTFSLKNPKKANYKFMGWYDADDNKVTKVVKGTTGNLSFTAKWSPVKYKIKYNLKGGSLGDDPVVYTTEDEFPLPTPYRAGAKFICWKMGNQVVTTIKMGTSGNKTVTAVWELNKYTISYDPNGGTTVKNKTEYTITTGTFTLKAPKKVGYKFDGWYDQDGEKVVKIVKGSHENLRLTARWTPVQYKLGYSLKGGTVYDAPNSYTIEDRIVLPIPQREGYKFMGWKKGSNYITVIEKGTTGNMTLTATWLKY